jgi:sterol desaturase/sphingolipid hydroxylase (fatty acid hydroxylase superfamily)
MICHLPLTNWIFKVPGLLFLREHHRLHHDQIQMSEKNFNIVIPIWDFLMRSIVYKKSYDK